MATLPYQIQLARYEVFELERFWDPSGTLHVGELSARGSGSFNRFYFLTGVPAGGRRGGHAHKQQQEYIICVQGGVTVHVESLGCKNAVALTRAGKALYLPAGYWRDLVDFSADAVIAVLASDPFSESDYIRDIEAFRRWESTGA